MLRRVPSVRGIRWVLPAAFVLGIGLSACLADSCIQPIGAGIVAHIKAPAGPHIAPETVGACAPWVEVDGRFYRDRRSDGWGFDLARADLVEAGEASGASPLVGELAGPRIFLIDDLDPKQFLAMQAGDGSFFIIVPDGTENTVDVVAVLCRYAVASSRAAAEHCGETSLVPSD
jgi:hypothetical protein